MDPVPAVILAIVAGVGILIVAIRGALEAGLKKVAELGAQNANWGIELKNELQKVRGTERQALRLKAYSALWKMQRPLAIYEPGESGQPSGFGPEDAEKLLKAQSDWYFVEAGGLVLTPYIRDFYFAWQELLKAVMEKPDWRAQRSSDKPDKLFRSLLDKPTWSAAKRALDTLNYIKKMETLKDWPDGAAAHAGMWEDDIAVIGARWNELTPQEQFAVLQQVSSTLRTAMTYDMETRLR